MAFARITSNSGADESGSSGTTITAQLTGVSAGSAIVVWVKHEGVDSVTISVSDGTSSFSSRPIKHHTVADILTGQFFYLLSSVASGTVTYTATFSAGVPYRSIGVYELSHGATAVFDTSSENATDISTGSPNITSGVASTSVATAVAFGSYGESSTSSLSSPLINGAAADHTQNVSTYGRMWMGVLSATFTDGAATASMSTNGNPYVCCMLVLKEQSTAYSIAADSGSYTLTGTAAAFPWSRIMTMDAGSYAITGTNATLTSSVSSTYSLTCDAGGYTITGTTVNPTKGTKIVANGGSYTITSDTQCQIDWNANTEPDLAGYKVYHGTTTGVYTESVDVGNVLVYVWTGLTNATHYFVVTAYDTSLNESAPSAEVSKVINQAAVLTYNSGDPNVFADAGLYAITGTDSTLAKGSKIDATTGAYAITGTDVTLTKGFGLTAESGTYIITGEANNLLYLPDASDYAIQGESGVYNITGGDVSFRFRRQLGLGGNAYVITGTDVTFKRGYTLQAEGGSYTLSRRSTTLRYSADPQPMVKPRPRTSFFRNQ